MHKCLVAGRKTRGYARYSHCFISFTVLPDRPLQLTLEPRSRRTPTEPSTTSSTPLTRSSLVVPRQEASPFRSVSLIFVLTFLRKNLTNYVCTQILCLYNFCIRILVVPGL